MHPFVRVSELDILPTVKLGRAKLQLPPTWLDWGPNNLSIQLVKVTYFILSSQFDATWVFYTQQRFWVGQRQNVGLAFMQTNTCARPLKGVSREFSNGAVTQLIDFNVTLRKLLFCPLGHLFGGARECVRAWVLARKVAPVHRPKTILVPQTNQKCAAKRPW